MKRGGLVGKALGHGGLKLHPVSIEQVQAMRFFQAREKGVTNIVSLGISTVRANQALSWRIGWPESGINVARIEQFLIDAQRVVVQFADKFHLVLAGVMERLVMHVEAENVVAKLHVIDGVKNVGMPEWIDDVRYRMLVAAVHDRHSIVHLQRQNAFVEKLFGWVFALTFENLLGLGPHAGEISPINQGDLLCVKRGQRLNKYFCELFHVTPLSE